MHAWPFMVSFYLQCPEWCLSPWVVDRGLWVNTFECSSIEIEEWASDSLKLLLTLTAGIPLLLEGLSCLSLGIWAEQGSPWQGNRNQVERA
jgi:hypothetical protein